ncbi:MAG: hypothetical protein U0X86_000859 [Wolbachia endosymbiont of Xenopsylla cheopis]
MALVAAAVAAPVTMGIAIFDRSRGINDPIVIAGGVFFALTIFSSIIGSCLKGVCAQAADPNSLRTELNNPYHTYQFQREYPS